MLNIDRALKPLHLFKSRKNKSPLNTEADFINFKTSYRNIKYKENIQGALTVTRNDEMMEWNGRGCANPRTPRLVCAAPYIFADGKLREGGAARCWAQNRCITRDS